MDEQPNSNVQILQVFFFIFTHRIVNNSYIKLLEVPIGQIDRRIVHEAAKAVR